jgi:hypothetical protein
MKRTVKTKESRQIEESLLIEGEESIDDVIEEILASDLPEEEEEDEMDSEEEGESEEEEQEGEEDDSCMYNSDDEESEYDYDSEEDESEDLQLDEAISPELKELIDDFIAIAGDARSDGDANEVLAKIKKHPGGEKIAKDLEDGWDKMYFGRSNRDDGKGDSLSRAKGRVTKAGKLNKTDAAKLKSIIKAKYGMKESQLDEDLQLDEAISDTLKDLIYDFIGAAGDARSDENINDILSKIKKQPGGEKIAKDLEDGFDKIHSGRPNNQNDGRPQDLSRAPGRVTKAGKLNKTDAAKLKSIIKAKYGMKESRDMARLIESEEGLTEEFKSKAALIFESEVALRVSEIRESLESKYEQKLEENVEKISEHLTLQIDEYLTYAVDQWIESNQVAIESSLRTDIAEGFMNSLKTLFTENYVEVPESKVDLYNELEQKAGSLEKSLKTTKKLAESLQEKVKTLSREKIIAEESKGLAETQSAKLLKLSESVEFQNEKDFAKKLKTLKEFYFKSEDKTLMDPINEESDIDVTFETIVEGLEEQNGEPAVPKEMKRYLETLTRLHKSSI